jgi:hypothetical protein
LKALVAGLLPCLAPIDHALMGVADPLLAFLNVVCGTGSQSEGESSEKQE